MHVNACPESRSRPAASAESLPPPMVSRLRCGKRSRGTECTNRVPGRNNLDEIVGREVDVVPIEELSHAVNEQILPPTNLFVSDEPPAWTSMTGDAVAFQ